MKNMFEFQGFRTAKLWLGRYARIPGSEPAFHVSTEGVITAKWTDHDTDERLTAKMVSSPATKALAKALNKTKEEHTEQAGGSFLINEYGQVICPVWPSRDRYWVGNVGGDPEFHDPVNGETFTLKPTRNLKSGAQWKWPYIGMKFNLSNDDRIYFKHGDGDTTTTIWLGENDPQLVGRLREIRPGGSTIRFIVNLHGAVFTKVETEYQSWRPVFVGFINPDKWFPKES